MCQAPVGKVIGVRKNGLRIEYKGKTRELRSNLVDVREGDYVLFSLDIAIDKIDKDEAETISGNMK